MRNLGNKCDKCEISFLLAKNLSEKTTSWKFNEINVKIAKF